MTQSDGSTSAVSPLDEKGTAFFAEHYADPIIHLATAVYVGSLLKLKDFPFNAGNSEVTVMAGSQAAELTPKGYKPSNELDALLYATPGVIAQKITFPFLYDRGSFWRAIAMNKFPLADALGVQEIQVRQGVSKDRNGLMVELVSTALQRKLLIDISGSA